MQDIPIHRIPWIVQIPFVGAGSQPAPTEPASTHHRHQHALGRAAGLRSAIPIIRVTYRHGRPLQSAPDREYGWRGSMAAALHTARHAHNERVRQFIQYVPARLERRTVTWPVAQNGISCG